MTSQTWAEEAQRIAFAYAVPIGGRILGAIVLWGVGRVLIGAVQGIVDRGLDIKKVDTTLARYARSIIGVSLTMLLLLAILSLFGVETTSFAGLLTAGGVAVGMAWSGLLSNFAAGVFLVILRPFKVGDVITAAAVTGMVKEIGLFATTIDTGENIRNFVGNAKIFGDTIQNFTANPHRRVELKVQLDHSIDPDEAVEKIRGKVAELPNVLKEPAATVDLVELGPLGPILAVRLHCLNEHHGSLTSAAIKAVRLVLVESKYPLPEQRHVVRKVG